MLPYQAEPLRKNASSVPPHIRDLFVSEVAVKAGEVGLAHSALARLSENLSKLVDVQLVKCIRVAELAGNQRVVADVIGEAMTREVLSPQLALAVLQMAHNSGNANLAADLESVLADRVEQANSSEFYVSAAGMRNGPEALLSLRRSVKGGRRSSAQAARHGAELIAAGENKVAYRYLRRCHRRWPLSNAIRLQYLSSILHSGEEAEALGWLKGLIEREGLRATEDLRLRFASESGETATMHQILSTKVKEGRLALGNADYLRVLIFDEDLDEAEKVASALKMKLGTTTHQSAHFSVKHLGTLLNELKLYQRHRKTTGERAPGAIDVQNYFFAAKRVLDDWCDDKLRGKSSRVSSVPRRIVQYWDTEDIPPAVRRLTETWRSASNWDYVRFSRRSAIKWLNDTFGADHVQAFRRANNVAEESDFFRLCWLLAEGGIYADTDDKLLTTPDDIAGFGSGLILFREPCSGAIANNVICAPKGHPVIETAVNFALTALLQKDNDNTWSKTGPGLLTRSAALHIGAHPEKADCDVTFVSRIHLRRFVQLHVPLHYKKTSSYWNAAKSPIDPLVASALLEASKAGRAVS